MHLETESFLLFVPTTSVAYLNWEYQKATFEGGIRYVVMSLVPKDGGDVLRYEVLSEILKVHNEITQNLTTSENMRNFTNYCNRFDPLQPCQFDNFLAPFGYDEDMLAAANDAGIIRPSIQSLEAYAPLVSGLGSVELDDSGALVSAKVFRLAYTLDEKRTDLGDRPKDFDGVLEFEKGMCVCFSAHIQISQKEKAIYGALSKF